MIIAKYIVTNSVNSNKTEDWEIFQTQAEFQTWKERNDKKVLQWNTDIPGATSLRFGSTETWDSKTIRALTIGDAFSMPLEILLQILASQKENKSI